MSTIYFCAILLAFYKNSIFIVLPRSSESMNRTLPHALEINACMFAYFKILVSEVEEMLYFALSCKLKNVYSMK